jgi:hypothetical protein
MVGSIPQNFLWVAKLLGLKGSVKNGLQELKNVSKMNLAMLPKPT